MVIRRSILMGALPLIIASAVAPACSAETDAPEASSLSWRPIRSQDAVRQVAAQGEISGQSTHRIASSSVSGTSTFPRGVPRRPTTPVKSENGTLPSAHGQVWREYDIRPYTKRVTATVRPEQAIIDWILQETGYEVWHSEPLGVLSATPDKLRVYHTPEMHSVVSEIVDRFIATEAETQTFSLRVITVDHPAWRTKAQRWLRPVAVQTPGVGAWLMQKEEAALLTTDLRRRSGYREHASPQLMVNNGQSHVIADRRGLPFTQSVTARTDDVWPGFDVEPGEIEEGFSLEFRPLLSADRQFVDAVIQCNIDQVERLVPVRIDVPTPVAPHQTQEIQVPQVTHFRFRERFRWPSGQVLLVGMGMVASPVPTGTKSGFLGLPISSAPRRGDLLLFVEAKGRSRQPALRGAPLREARTYRRRY